MTRWDATIAVLLVLVGNIRNVACKRKDDMSIEVVSFNKSGNKAQIIIRKDDSAPVTRHVRRKGAVWQDNKGIKYNVPETSQ